MAEIERLREELRVAKEDFQAQKDRSDFLSTKRREDIEAWRQAYRELEEQIRFEKEQEKARDWKECWVSSPLTKFKDIVSKSSDGGWGWKYFAGSCPCCRRPLDITLHRASDPPEAQAAAQSSGVAAGDAAGGTPVERVAYCAALWGSNAGYALGAMVLGHRLKELDEEDGRAAGPDRVLIHTDDVPPNYLKALEKVWWLKKVDYIDGVKALYNSKGTIFDGVFTKLSAWTLTYYNKVLLLDLDLIPLRPLRSLFELEPPAALIRGSNNYVDGHEVDGRSFFASEEHAEYPWGQTGGINAGVILLKPDKWIFERMLNEVTAEYHPCHIAGSGPEQDYLTRFFAAATDMNWRHISLKWNFQLHHVPFALERAISWRWQALIEGREYWFSDDEWLPPRLALPMEEINVIHFSGDVKLWHMLLEANVSSDATAERRRAFEHFEAPHEECEDPDAVFAEKLLKDQRRSYSLWVDKDAEPQDYATWGCILTPEKRFKMLPDAEKDVTTLVEKSMGHLRSVARLATETWRCSAERLLKEMPTLIEDLKTPQVPEGALPIGTMVDVLWVPLGEPETKGRWHAGRVSAVHEDGSYVVKFNTSGEWGDTQRRVPAARVQLKPPWPPAEPAQAEEPASASPEAGESELAQDSPNSP